MKVDIIVQPCISDTWWPKQINPIKFRRIGQIICACATGFHVVNRWLWKKKRINASYNDSYFIWNLRVFSQTAFLNEAVKRMKKEGRSGHEQKKKRTALLSSFVNSCAERKKSNSWTLHSKYDELATFCPFYEKKKYKFALNSGFYRNCWSFHMLHLVEVEVLYSQSFLTEHLLRHRFICVSIILLHWGLEYCCLIVLNMKV